MFTRLFLHYRALGLIEERQSRCDDGQFEDNFRDARAGVVRGRRHPLNVGAALASRYSSALAPRYSHEPSSLRESKLLLAYVAFASNEALGWVNTRRYLSGFPNSAKFFNRRACWPIT